MTNTILICILLFYHFVTQKKRKWHFMLLNTLIVIRGKYMINSK